MRALIEGEINPDSLKHLQRAIDTIPCSSAQCERDFSLMNLICSETRSSLKVTHISNLMVISSNGPPLSRWQPEEYVKSWLLEHRSADDTRSRTVDRNKCTDDKFLWNIL